MGTHHSDTAIILFTLDRIVYELDENGAVLWRSNGPKGWDYSGKWLIVGFKRRHHSRETITLDAALGGADTGQGWVIDRDHGTLRMWGTRLASVSRVVA